MVGVRKEGCRFPIVGPGAAISRAMSILMQVTTEVTFLLTENPKTLNLCPSVLRSPKPRASGSMLARDLRPAATCHGIQGP